MHHTNIQVLATELHKIKNELSPEIFTEIFTCETECHYNLRQCNDFRIPSIRTFYQSSDSISFLGPKIGNLLPDEINSFDTTGLNLGPTGPMT